MRAGLTVLAALSLVGCGNPQSGRSERQSAVSESVSAGSGVAQRKAAQAPVDIALSASEADVIAAAMAATESPAKPSNAPVCINRIVTSEKAVRSHEDLSDFANRGGLWPAVDTSASGKQATLSPEDQRILQAASDQVLERNRADPPRRSIIPEALAPDFAQLLDPDEMTLSECDVAIGFSIPEIVGDLAFVDSHSCGQMTSVYRRTDGEWRLYSRLPRSIC
ncbi:hypothetical protein GCM10010990_00540 [Croceicoccus mobilis]|uniref:Uncharacterized protein n=1 Tax=Croceicoccus mobilis TaxID=1703339 RepID=A0A916YPQ8_9SPHN|nr:hypothetical protein GCM10010990_00540 [Croceicoccus mobilis]